MEFGRFSPDSREYIITRPDTPTPWINYLSNQEGYCGIVSQTGGGFSFHRDPRDRRLTKYRYNNVPVDRPGRYFYLKDHGTGEAWSPTWQPVQRPLRDFECRHGQGYTCIESSYQDLRHRVTYFVPVHGSCEIWHLRLINEGREPRTLSIYTYAEFTTWCEPESRNIQWSLHLTRGDCLDGLLWYRFLEPHPSFIRTQNANYRADRPGGAFMASNLPVADFECVRDRFIGMYRSETNPLGVEQDRLGDSILRGGVGCGALRHELTLAAGAAVDLIVVLGFAESVELAGACRDRFRDAAAVERELQAVRAAWADYFSVLQVDTPDGRLDAMVNVWNQYQCKTTFDWSRYISFYENGEGRGMGTRDSCQDVLSICAHLPERARDRIVEILSTCQFATGDCYHQYFPLGHRGDLHGFSDDHLWLVQMVHAYVSETGDLDFLQRQVAFAEDGRPATVYGHLLAAVDFTAGHLGPHGLPLILNADWNDTLHLWMECEDAESVLVAELYVHALKLLADLAELAGTEAEAGRLRARAAEMTGRVNEHCWDGDWYLRGFGSEPIGTCAAASAKIFLEPQVWGVIAGASPPERARAAMESVRQYLDSPEGIKLLWPPFTEYDQTYGLISRYNAGRKENGIFCHAHAWAIVAEALLRRGEQAHEYYRKVAPIYRNDRAEQLRTEPYVFCQTVCSDDARDCGEGANSWLTGTASWMFVAVTQYLLGVRPTPRGLLIDPCLPPGWGGFTMVRAFRGCRYEIEVRRGSAGMTVDGKACAGKVIPVCPDARCRVVVEV